MTRRKLLFAGAASAAAAASYPTLIEPSWLEVTTTRISLGRGGGGRIRVLQLTDLHASFEVPISLISRAIELGMAENPDVVCLTGDFVTRGLDVDSRRYEAALRRLTSRPVYAVLGNHDGGAWAVKRRGLRTPSQVVKLLEQAGIEVLDNKRRVLRANGSDIRIAGLSDLWSGGLDPDTALPDANDGIPTILLAHNPDTKDMVRRHPWNLMLSGHTHGGQVIIPFEGPRFAPVKDKRYVAGLGQWEGRQIYVSRGVGSISHVRLMCRPEVTILDITV